MKPGKTKMIATNLSLSASFSVVQWYQIMCSGDDGCQLTDLICLSECENLNAVFNEVLYKLGLVTCCGIRSDNVS